MSAIFELLAMANISVDTNAQNISINQTMDLTFTASKDDLNKATEVIISVAKSMGGRGLPQQYDAWQGEYQETTYLYATQL